MHASTSMKQERRATMTSKKLGDQLNKMADSPSGDEGRTRQGTQLPIYYRCSCPECGGEDLELLIFGFFLRGTLLCVNTQEDIGCEDTFLETGDYNYVLECGDCGFTLSADRARIMHKLMGQARTLENELQTLAFTCPVCESKHLYQLDTQATIRRSIEAVYADSAQGEKEKQPVVALTYEPVMPSSGERRYECSGGHELVKVDGSPVENAEELVEWLKAHRPSTTE